tara:strand:+ start:711 stop:1709 length:999 start_codon:yes stop_codon:yes gene_type:complete
MKKIIFVNIIVILTIIIALEILLRTFNLVTLQGADRGFFFSENNIVLNKPNSIFMVGGKKVKTDVHGFRIPLQNNQIKKNLKSTFILGDSVTFGFGVDEKDTFVGVTRDKVNSNLINSSVIGHNLKSYIYLLNKHAKSSKINFDEAIIFLCLNDIHLDQGVVSKENLKNNSNQTKESLFINFLKNDIFMKLNLSLREKSALFVLLKSVATNNVKRHYEYMQWRYNDKTLLLKYSEYIKEIKNFSESENLNINFVLLPYAYQIKKNCNDQYLKPQKEIRKIFTELGLNLYDFTDNFCAKKENKNFFIGFDPVHLSKAGHLFVSRLLIENKIIN